MERVAFLIDSSGERVDCLLNPETVQVTRLAGVRQRGVAGGQLTGSGLADDPLVFTGGGRTELVLDLLFDVDFVEAQVRPSDVRVLTRPLWMLAENSAAEHGWLRPPLVRLVWGKTWNVPGVIIAVAERFDAFTGTGSPRRSWLRLKLVRAAETADQAEAGFAEELARRAHRPPPRAARWSPPATARPSRAAPGCASTCWPTTRSARRCAGGCWPSTTGSPTPSRAGGHHAGHPADRCDPGRRRIGPGRGGPCGRQRGGRRSVVRGRLDRHRASGLGRYDRNTARQQPRRHRTRQHRGYAVTSVAPRALTVLLDGVELADAARQRIRSLRVAARLDQPTQAELVLSTTAGGGAFDPAVRPGTSLDVRLAEHPDALFTGEVTCVEVEYAADGAAVLRLRAYDALHRLRKRQGLRVFTSVTAAELARELCGEVGLDVTAETDGPRLERLLQHRHSDLELLREVTGRAGLHLAADGDGVRLITLAGYGEPVALALGVGVHSLRLATNLDQASGASAALGWHPQRAEPISQQADEARCGRPAGDRPDPADVGADGVRTAVDQPGRSDDELAALAQARLDTRAAALVTAEGWPRATRRYGRVGGST
ncbi:hypothetical protein GCM10027614_12960 [Micromonospora vulcania]